jgi:hypothetical protein
MYKVAIKTEKLKEALKDYNKDISIQLSDGKSTTIPFIDANKDLLSFLNDIAALTPPQKSKVNSFLFSSDYLLDLKVSSTTDLFNKLNFISGSEDPVLELSINNKWYPIPCSVSKFKTMNGGWMVEINLFGQIGGLQYGKNIYIGDWDFENKAGDPVSVNVTDLLKKNNLQIASKESILKAKKATELLIKYSAHASQIFDASGTGLIFHDYWGWSDINIGWKDSPAAVIVEPILENRYAHREIPTDSWQMPFIRVFSLKHKNYMYVDVEDITDHIFHRDGKDKIVLPQKMFNALESIFNAKQANIFGDLFHGRHGGIVILANGPSGVGKTLTAEVFAEFQERPLYSMEMSEIGTSLKEVEANLQKIFSRAKKWNAVLLFDEADIFLSERVASDLERSAIVGIFLRLLDYYEGTFFLTTNRGEGIDAAFKSRVTLYLNYPALSPDTRQTIWTNMLKSAGLTVSTDYISLSQISEAELNGRQIRNQVRLLKLMHPDGQLYTSDILASLEFAAK